MTSTELNQTDHDGIDDLSVLPPAPPIQARAFDQLSQTVEAMKLAAQFATSMCRTTAVPDIYRIGSKVNERKTDDEVIGNAAAAVLYGLELEITPTQSLQNVFSVGGKPAIYARTAAALLRRKGFKTWTESTSDESVTVIGTSPDGQITEASTWTIERAEKAGYVPTIDESTGDYRKNKWGRLIGNEKYLTDPQAMLHAKALMEVCRKLAPDVLMGIGDGDDAPLVDDGSEDAAPRRVQSTSPTVDDLRARLAGASERRRAAVEQKVAPADPVESETAAPAKQDFARLNDLFSAAGLDGRAKARRKRVTETLLGRVIEDDTPMTGDECAQVIEVLSGWQADGVIGEKVVALLDGDDRTADGLTDTADVDDTMSMAEAMADAEEAGQ